MVAQTATHGPVSLALAFSLDFGHFHTPRSLTLMITVLVHHEVADYPTWKSVFDAALDWRRQHGERSCRIFHSAGNVNDLILIFEWESLEQARAFMASDELKARMAKAGVKSQPRVDYMTEMYTIRRSAAD
jgi:heme-degrading monooxygenase HmoA